MSLYQSIVMTNLQRNPNYEFNQQYKNTLVLGRIFIQLLVPFLVFSGLASRNTNTRSPGVSSVCEYTVYVLHNGPIHVFFLIYI